MSHGICQTWRIKLEDPDDDDELDNCTFVVALMQKDRRKEKVLTRGKGGMLTMGFAIYKVSALWILIF